MDCLANCFKWLMEYPIKETPYPKGYPDELKFDYYPGQDFVVGLCDEQINELLLGLTKQKDKEVRELIKNYINLYKDIRIKRLAKLGAK